MDRRTFLISAAASGLALPAFAGAGIAYTPGLVSKKLAEGDTVFVDFYTEWCTTCARQQRILAKLKSENPAYEKNITFVSVDWDQHSRSKLSQSLKIPRRSTLVALSGKEELGRIVAGTRESDIKALLDKSLKSAMA